MRNRLRQRADGRLALVLILLLVGIAIGLPAGPARPQRGAFPGLVWGLEDSSFQVVREAYSKIRKNHYEDPKYSRLVLGALKGINGEVASKKGEDKVQLNEEAENVRWRIGSKEITISLDEENGEDLQPLGRAYELARSTYFPESKEGQELAYAAIRGMIRSLDPHSALMTPEAFRELQVETRGEFGGIGIEITIRDENLTVVSPIDGTPAYRLGIQAGDQIVQIDDFNTKGITLRGAVRRMRGPKGTSVTLHIRRANVEKPLIFSIVRDIIRIQSVKSKVLPGKIGYIRLRTFVESTSRDLKRALRSLKEQDIQGLILDLRNNPGGLLRQAVEVSDLFLGKGTLIVSTRGKRREHNLRFVDRRGGPFWKTPMIILVNSGSASASEIVTGALQDLQRALVMGTRTFGKGSVQTIIPLNDGSGLRLTTALYYTPKGREIQEKGIPPDAVVRQPGDRRKQDVVLEKELLRRHKNRNQGGSSKKADFKDKPADDPPATPKKQQPRPKPIRFGSKEDHQLSVARRVLGEAPVRRVAQLMIRARQILASLSQSKAQAGSKP